MSLEMALVNEFASIEGLKNKTFPLNAPESAKTPYVVYVSSDGSFDKTLQGFESSRSIRIELNVIHSSYGSMKNLTSSVLEKIRSFEGRSIGTSNMHIQEVSYENPVELHETEVDLYRCVIDLTLYI